MTKTGSASMHADADASRKTGDARTSRTIRFSDPEWQKIEEAASRRANSPAEFVRNAALRTAADTGTGDPHTLSPAAIEVIESIYRGVYFLATLKRDELMRQGRQEDIDGMLEAARKSLSEIKSCA